MSCFFAEKLDISAGRNPYFVEQNPLIQGVLLHRMTGQFSVITPANDEIPRQKIDDLSWKVTPPPASLKTQTKHEFCRKQSERGNCA
jgi:hypothetical protein